MPTPGYILTEISKKLVKRDEVPKISLGNLNGDGKTCIVFGGGISQENVKSVIWEISDIEAIKQSHGFDIQNNVKISLCFDINNDGIDEIIFGDFNGQVTLVRKRGDQREIKKLNKFESRVEDIKGIKIGTTNYLFSCSSDGNLGICKTIGKKIQCRKENLKFPVLSIFPFYFKRKLFLIAGGEGKLAIYRIMKKKDVLKLIDDFKLLPITSEKSEKIYCIAQLSKNQKALEFVCGFRSGKIIAFTFSNKVSYSTGYLSKYFEKYGKSGSIYDIMAFDMDECGKNEVIAAGEIRVGAIDDPAVDDLGFIEIIKVENNTFKSIHFKKCKKKVYSVQVFIDPVSNKKTILASGPKIALICFEFKLYILEDLISLISSQISSKPGNFCIFVGAGISSDIFPLADEFSNQIIKENNLNRERILEYLLDNEKSKKFLKLTKGDPDRIPLEAILFYYKKFTSRDAMIELVEKQFNKQVTQIPLSIQKICHLLKTHKINYIFSVNYDLLLDQGTSDIDIKKINYNKEFTLSNIGHKQAIFKIHGSISDPDSIEASLDEVARLRGNKKQLLESFFNGHTFIFVGYSCRDPDLYPALKQFVTKYRTNCYFVDPAEPNEYVRDLIKSSRQGDLTSRYFRMEADIFFEILDRNLNKDEKIGLTTSKSEGK
jgi:hypothetical protein